MIVPGNLHLSREKVVSEAHSEGPAAPAMGMGVSAHGEESLSGLEVDVTFEVGKPLLYADVPLRKTVYSDGRALAFRIK